MLGSVLGVSDNFIAMCLMDFGTIWCKILSGKKDLVMMQVDLEAECVTMSEREKEIAVCVCW